MTPLHVLLADDDRDDCDLFLEALQEIEQPTQFTSVHDGEQLMARLQQNDTLPHILFLDLNMPRINGFECLEEIKADPRLANIPIIVFSTSFEAGIVNQLYNNGAMHYIRKPNDFVKLRTVITSALSAVSHGAPPVNSLEQFVLQP
jgi:CheY-like chemotaxis protein